MVSGAMATSLAEPDGGDMSKRAGQSQVPDKTDYSMEKKTSTKHGDSMYDLHIYQDVFII